MDRSDLEREKDIEELRRVALAQQAQIQILLDAIAKQNRELAAFKGTKSNAQLTLKLLEALQAKAKDAAEALARAEATPPKPERKPPAASGPTPPTARVRAAAVD